MVANVAYRQVVHIDAHSGYAQLPRYLADRVQVRTIEPARLPGPLAQRLARSAGSAFYEPVGARLELAVARRLLAAPDEVCHLLYAEDHFNHLARLGGLPLRRGALVATFHQPPEVAERVLAWPDLRERLAALDAAIALAPDQAGWLAERMPPERVHLVPGGVNAHRFRPAAAAPPEPPVRCLSVGSWLRDHDVLAQAIGLVAARSDEVAFEVVVPERERERFVGLPRTHVRVGLTSEELLDAYRSAHLAVLAVTGATRNNALGEALACGLPVVATAVGGVPTTLGEAGVLTPPGDAQALAAAIVALARSPARRRALGRLARERAEQLDWPHAAWSTVRVYEAALELRRGAGRARARMGARSARRGPRRLEATAGFRAGAGCPGPERRSGLPAGPELDAR
ncbi:MAG: glycosyltransferase [Thermoleophilia bacterium]